MKRLWQREGNNGGKASGIYLFNASPDNLGDLLMLHCAVANLARNVQCPLVLPCGYSPESIADIESLVNIEVPDDVAGVASRIARKVRRAAGSVSGGGVLKICKPAEGKGAKQQVVRISHAIDLCGFAFSDQWGKANAELHLNRYRSLAAHGVSIVKLPASFGPFQDESVRGCLKEAMSYCKLIFARDPLSYSLLNEVVQDEGQVHFCPDFTGSSGRDFPGVKPHSHRRIVVIPNFRMVDKSGFLGSRTDYSSYLIEVLRFINEELREVPVLLLHDRRSDLDYIEKMEFEKKATVIIEHLDKPLSLKAFIGGASAVISSRYHGAANALSQGVPCIGTSWSHKYEYLFKEYDQLGWLVQRDCEDPLGETKHLLRQICSGAAPCSDPEAMASIDCRVSNMWKRVFSVLAPNA